MISIYHGTDIVSSRKAFIDKKDESTLSFDAETASIENILQALEGLSLFTSTHKIFIENIFTKKSSILLKAVSDTLLNKSKAVDIYLWESGELSAKALSAFKDAEAQSFKLPQNLFAFLDSIRPGNNQSVSLFHKTLEEADENIVFFMIIRQFRLLWASYGAYGIDEAKRMAPWQTSKLKRQSEYFGEDRLRVAYKKLHILDRQHKTGALSASLPQSIDFFLLDL